MKASAEQYAIQILFTPYSFEHWGAANTPLMFVVFCQMVELVATLPVSCGSANFPVRIISSVPAFRSAQDSSSKHQEPP
eukprot:2090550-Pyramimonas_sp.AAC.1